MLCEVPTSRTERIYRVEEPIIVRLRVSGGWRWAEVGGVEKRKESEKSEGWDNTEGQGTSFIPHHAHTTNVIVCVCVCVCVCV